MGYGRVPSHHRTIRVRGEVVRGRDEGEPSWLSVVSYQSNPIPTEVNTTEGPFRQDEPCVYHGV